MASYTAISKARHKTTTADAADDLSFTGNKKWFRVRNREASAGLWYTYTLDNSTPTTPTAAGDDTYFVAAGTAEKWELPGGGTSVTVKVKVIFDATVAGKYSVEAG